MAAHSTSIHRDDVDDVDDDVDDASLACQNACWLRPLRRSKQNKNRGQQKKMFQNHFVTMIYKPSNTQLRPINVHRVSYCCNCRWLSSPMAPLASTAHTNYYCQPLFELSSLYTCSSLSTLPAHCVHAI